MDARWLALIDGGGGGVSAEASPLFRCVLCTAPLAVHLACFDDLVPSLLASVKASAVADADLARFLWLALDIGLSLQPGEKRATPQETNKGTVLAAPREMSCQACGGDVWTHLGRRGDVCNGTGGGGGIRARESAKNVNVHACKRGASVRAHADAAFVVECRVFACVVDWSGGNKKVVCAQDPSERGGGDGPVLHDA